MRVAAPGAGRIGAFRARVSELPEVEEVTVSSRTVKRAEVVLSLGTGAW